MAFGQKDPVQTAPKSAATLASELEATQAWYQESLAQHKQDIDERHSHVTERLASLEAEANQLEGLRQQVASA